MSTRSKLLHGCEGAVSFAAPLQVSPDESTISFIVGVHQVLVVVGSINGYTPVEESPTNTTTVVVKLALSLNETSPKTHPITNLCWVAKISEYPPSRVT